jgi:hypothetical protein
MVRRRVSVPEGVERILDNCSIVRSAFLRYIGSQLWRVCNEGMWGGTVDAGTAEDLPAAGVPCASDILKTDMGPRTSKAVIYFWEVAKRSSSHVRRREVRQMWKGERDWRVNRG